MDALFTAIRESCDAATWSRGVKLCRGDAVVGVADRGDEIEMRVRVPGQTVAPAVYLYPADEDWSCECSSEADVCFHVAGAVIALRQARKDGVKLPGGSPDKPRATVGYRLTRDSKRLALDRVLCTEQGNETDQKPLTGTLTQLSKSTDLDLVTTSADLEVEVALSHYGDGVIPPQLLRRIFKSLARVSDLQYGGKPVDLLDPHPGLCARVEDCAEGFRVRIEQHPKVREVFENGALRFADGIAPLGDNGLNQRLFDELRRGKIYPESQAGTVAGELLPSLRERLDVLVDSQRLPGSTKIKPRLQVHSERIGDDLDLICHVVYGDPPVVRVEGDGTLKRLGKGPVPLRDSRREGIIDRHIRLELGLELGQRMRFSAEEGIKVRQTLAESKMACDQADRGDLAQFYEAAPLVPRLALGSSGPDGSGGSAGIDDMHFDSPVDAGWNESGGALAADPASVLRAYESGSDLAPLLGGGFAPVPMAFMRENGHLVRALLQAKADGEGGTGAALPPWSMLDMARLCEALNQPPPPDFVELRRRLEGDPELTELRLPDGLQAELRDYQRVGVGWMQSLRRLGLGALLADDMGLGKTLQTICVLEGRSLVVAPTSILPNWQREISRFRPGLKVELYHGDRRSLDPSADVTLTTYGLLRLDQKQLGAVQWDALVLDESQTIKNPDSQVARAAYEMPAKFRIALTGTPVENRLEDLWSQLHFLNRGFLGGRSDFHERYAKPIGDGDAAAGARLRKRVSPLLLRRHKSEVAKELPPRTEMTLYCELSRDERAVYDSVLAATRDDVAGRAGFSALQILEALLRLRQASCHGALLKPEVPPPSSSKLDLLSERLTELTEAGHKALVFSQWTGFLDLVGRRLDEDGMGFVRLDGSTRDRGAVVDAFQDSSGPQVMLISLKAGGTGLNLTAADHVFLLDPWWNPAVEDQAADRAHRIGQDKPVFVHRLVAKDTVEEGILALQESKRALAQAAIAEGGGGSQVTRAELLALLA